MKLIVTIVAIFALLTTISAQTVNINCDFVMLDTRYSCVITGIQVPDDENANIVIGGQHQPGRTNADVQRVRLLDTFIPFVIKQFFTTFPNVDLFDAWNSGLTRIQSYAFANATSLRFAYIRATFRLTTVEANAFTGATNLDHIDIFNNRIETVHETAFTGLTNLRFLYMDQNLIVELPANLFRSLTSLEMLWLSDNQLQTLDGRLLENSSRLWIMTVSFNRINAIGRNFFDNLPALVSFAAFQNVCVNNSWSLGGTITIDTVRTALTACFDNFDAQRQNLS